MRVDLFPEPSQKFLEPSQEKKKPSKHTKVSDLNRDAANDVLRNYGVHQLYYARRCVNCGTPNLKMDVKRKWCLVCVMKERMELEQQSSGSSN